MKLFVRSVLVWMYALPFMIVASFAAFIVTIFDKSGDSAHICAKLWCMGIIKLSGIKIDVSGIEHLDSKNPQVLVTNHQGTFDIFALVSTLPVQFRWVVKKELFKIPFFGLAMRKAGYISIDRENSRQALKDLRNASTKLKTGRSIAIFPEGTRTNNGELGVFKRGSLFLATFSGNPIVPISINGSFQILKKGGFIIYPNPVRIIIHPPIQVADLSGKEQKELAEKVRAIIAEDLKVP